MRDERLKKYIPFLCAFALIAYPSSLIASPKEELAETQKAIAQSEAKQAKLAEDSERLETELKVLQGNMVALADSIQKNEAALSDLEDKLRILNAQFKEKTLELKKHQKNLELLIQAALSLSYTPAEAMITMPTSAMESMKAARALKMASDDVKREIQSIAEQLAELKNLQQKIAQNRDALAVKQAALDKERGELKGHIIERNTLLAKLGKERGQEAKKLAQLAKKAKDLKELMSSVEKDEEEQKQAHKEKTAHPEHALRSFADAKGHIRPPVVGRIVQRYSAGSKGITLSSRNNARVVAPYDGEVVFTGPFLAYGQMVIIRHSDDFHTLLAGLAKIDVSTGQFLLEGEPIGAMGEGESGDRLYIELRENNQPVDPALWMSGLNKKRN